MEPDFSQWAQAEIQELPFKHENIFKVMVVKQWNRLPREITESPSVETFRTWLDKVLSNLSLLSAALSRGSGPEYL